MDGCMDVHTDGCLDVLKLPRVLLADPVSYWPTGPPPKKDAEATERASEIAGSVSEVYQEVGGRVEAAVA